MRALAQVAAGGDDARRGLRHEHGPLARPPSTGAASPGARGLLYGDAPGSNRVAEPEVGDMDSAMPDAGGFVRWAAPRGARGHAATGRPRRSPTTRSGGVPAIDTGTAICMGSMRTGNHWNDDVLARFGVTEKQLPVVVNMGEAAGTLTGTDTVLAAGTVDALCDQIVSGADQAGDVLVIFGATLIVWAVVDDWIEAPGLWTLPHTVAGQGPRRWAEQRRRALRGLGPRPALRG